MKTNKFFIKCAIWFVLFEAFFWEGGKTATSLLHTMFFTTCLLDTGCSVMKTVGISDIVLSILFILIAIYCFTMFAINMSKGMIESLRGENEKRTSD